MPKNPLPGKTFFSFCFLFFLNATAFSCQTNPLNGVPYLDPEFSCKNGTLKSESDPGYLAYWSEYRKTIFTSPQDRKVLFLGDSTIALFKEDKMKELLPQHPAINHGIPGDTTALLLLRLKEDALLLQPSTIILEIGGNDILQGRCLKNILRNTSYILIAFKQTLPHTRVIVVSLPPVTTWKANAVVPHYNKQLEALVHSAGYEFMELWPILADPESPRLRGEFQIHMGGKIDQVHFNEEGYKAWAVELNRLLKKPKK